MIFRDFLFKIPKKYLVVVIVFLTMILLKSSVLGYSNFETIDVQDPTTDLVYYKYAYFQPNNTHYWIDTGVQAPFRNGNDVRTNIRIDARFKMRASYDSFLYLLNQMSYGDAYSTFNAGTRFYINMCGTQKGFYTFTEGVEYHYINSLRPDQELTGSLLPFYYLYNENEQVLTSGTYSIGNNNFNTSGTETIKICASVTTNRPATAYSYRNFKIYVYDTDYEDWVLAYNFYPCKYLDTLGDAVQEIPGFYDSVSNNFTYTTQMIFNENDRLDDIPDDILPPIPNYPYITNDTSTIENWSFDTLNISGGTITNSVNGLPNSFYLRQVYNDKTIGMFVDEYKTVDPTTDRVTFNIPRSVLLKDSAIVNDYSVNFNLDIITPLGVTIPYSLGTYTFNLTQTEQDNINQDKTQQSLDNISQAQQETTNAINNLSSNIVDDNVSSSVIQQPSVPSDTSGVESGVNNIFTVIMNAFTNFDSSQDVVLPIPFTNKNITISGNYTRDMLNSVNAGWVINFITIFWWYIISVYIIKDILKTVDKIQEGNIDKVESSNIKGDML